MSHTLDLFAITPEMVKASAHRAEVDYLKWIPYYLRFENLELRFPDESIPLPSTKTDEFPF